jgi:hypothetical protein
MKEESEFIPKTPSDHPHSSKRFQQRCIKRAAIWDTPVFKISWHWFKTGMFSHTWTAQKFGFAVRIHDLRPEEKRNGRSLQGRSL